MLSLRQLKQLRAAHGLAVLGAGPDLPADLLDALVGALEELAVERVVLARENEDLRRLAHRQNRALERAERKSRK